MFCVFVLNEHGAEVNCNSFLSLLSLCLCPVLHVNELDSGLIQLHSDLQHDIDCENVCEPTCSYLHFNLVKLSVKVWLFRSSEWIFRL